MDAKRETRNGPHTYSYYEDISSDDDILDIIAEQRAANDVDTMEAISDFDVSMLDNVSGHVNDVSSRDQQSVPGSSSVDSRSSGDDVDVTSDSSGSSSDVTESTVDYRSVCDSASVQDSNDSRKSDVTSVSSGGVSDRQSVVDGVSVTEHDVSDVDGGRHLSIERRRYADRAPYPEDGSGSMDPDRVQIFDVPGKRSMPEHG